MMDIERKELVAKYRELLEATDGMFSPQEIANLRSLFGRKNAEVDREKAIKSIIKAINTSLILLKEVNLGRVAVVCNILYDAVCFGFCRLEEVEQNYDRQIYSIVVGMVKANEIYKKNPSVESENFRKLLLSLVQDIRVIIIMICERLYVMRTLSERPAEEQIDVANEVLYLYAPLAHRLGLYRIKSELEDLSLKYTNSTIYHEIAHKLNETKRSRDAYIANFIKPLKEKLEASGYVFSIKGRTKSIYSIWNKMKKQNTPFENIYDLFAIRIIIDTSLEKEKSDCWQIYSIVTDMYQPNPKRLRDWLSIPKSNGYESLHTTVMGPQGRWVEIQIRTRRMDEIAEKGLAAHFKYKGIKGENNFDKWLANIRELLENPEANAIEYMDDFKLNLYDKDVFVFTPNGDLHRLPKGSTVLDFAFLIHSDLGAKCVGAKINGINEPIRHVLSNGDQVEILTSSTQKPRREWLSVVQTSKAKTRIRAIIRDEEKATAEVGKEQLMRRFKNWKIEYDDAYISRILKTFGISTLTDFFQKVANDQIDLMLVKERVLEQIENLNKAEPIVGAENYVHKTDLEEITSKEDVLVIDGNLKGIQYNLAKCCNPIYGDDIFGFITTSGGIKIHKTDCPNAPQMMSRFGYRFVKARWSGKAGSQYVVTLHVVGNDDVSIVTNVTSIIQKEQNITLRSISVDTVDGLFQGIITVRVNDAKSVETLIRKIETIKGIKSVTR